MVKTELISVIVPVSERADRLVEVCNTYLSVLAEAKLRFEFIVILNSKDAIDEDQFNALKSNKRIDKVICLGRDYGEATSIMMGIENSQGERIVILPPYEQIIAEEIPKVVAALDQVDMVVAKRYPRIDNLVNRIQGRVFNSLVKWVTNSELSDAGCNVRAMRRTVADKLDLYGDLHRFLPLLARQHGFKVQEVVVRQASADAHCRVYPLGLYVRRCLDILTALFLTRFTKKPLRFFGLLGMFSSVIGALGILYLVIDKMVFAVGIMDRPGLILFSMLIVLGVQLIAIGLVGETIIFSHAKDMKEYTVEEVIAHDN